MLNNVISQKKPPEELNSLVSTNSITIHNGTRQTKPEIALQKIASAKDRSSWRLNINHDFIWGLPGKTTGRHSPGKIMKDKSDIVAKRYLNEVLQVVGSMENRAVTPIQK